MTNKPPTPKPKYGLFEFLVGGLFCVGLPGLMTAIAPVSWLEFTRSDDRVSVKAETCTFFWFPYRTQNLDDVREVSTTFKQGGEIRQRRGERNQGRAESEGSVVLHGPKKGEADGEVIIVSVSPASTKQVEARIQEFLADPQQKQVMLFTVANWKVGIIFAIPVCLLTVLFAIGWSIWLGQTLAKPFHVLRHHEPPDTSEPADQ